MGPDNRRRRPVRQARIGGPCDDLEELAELVNIGTLFAFVLVSVAVLVLRRIRPDPHRAFRTPLVPVVPILAVLACLTLMAFRTVNTWVRFLVWMLIGLVVYFVYSRGGTAGSVDPTAGSPPVAGTALPRPTLRRSPDRRR